MSEDSTLSVDEAIALAVEWLKEGRVNDADAYYQEWSSKVSIPNPPRDEYWNALTFGFSAPSGNTIFVMGPAT